MDDIKSSLEKPVSIADGAADFYVLIGKHLINDETEYEDSWTKWVCEDVYGKARKYYTGIELCAFIKDLKKISIL